MAFHIITRNPLYRVGIINKLIKLGYSTIQNKNAQEYERLWPAVNWPIVWAQDNKLINLIWCDDKTTWSNELGREIKPSELNEMVREFERNKSSQAVVLPALVLPKAAKYNIEYTKADGKTGNYTISNPIEETTEEITAYAFQRGIRTFKKGRIQALTPM